MGGSLEVFKFGVYIFFPVFMMYHYGNPYWYIDNVLPVRTVSLAIVCPALGARLGYCLASSELATILCAAARRLARCAA